MGADIEESHMRNRAWVSSGALKKASPSVVEKVVRDGKTYIDIKTTGVCVSSLGSC